MEFEEITFKTTLVFWNMNETNLNYNNEQMGKVLKESKYASSIYDGYTFTNQDGEKIPLKWIAATGKNFVPHCFKILEDKFICTKSPVIHGRILIDGHVYPEEVLVLQARLDFDEYMKIEDLIVASIPDNIILSTGRNMKDTLSQLASEIIQELRENLRLRKEKVGAKASPWHHNWIWWDRKKSSGESVPIKEFEPDGKYFKWALGMCTRSDKWRKLDPENYSEIIEDVSNLSPYSGNCVYITHPGNVIIPSKDFLDPDAIKNTIIDVLFAAEEGNVQRYLILNHLQDFNAKSLKIQEIIADYQDKEKETGKIIDRLVSMEQDLNELVLEVNTDLQITRTPRLIFTSVFKTKLFKEMIDALHGFDFYDSLQTIITEVKEALERQRDIITMKVNEEENVFLRNLQIVFIIGLVAQMITLFYSVEGFDFNLGTIFTLVSVVVSLVILLLLKKIK
ncbi:MAG: hypothetical protein ACFFCS_10785 [Candidatus Hodarchaeota archaeon]